MGNNAGSRLPSQVDLVALAQRHYDFLKAIQTSPQLYLDKLLQISLVRYEKFWLPFASKFSDKVLLAPIDIELMWQIHLQNPVSYERDCYELAGRMIPHHMPAPLDRLNLLEKTRSLWMHHYPQGPPFEENLDPDCEAAQPFNSRLSSNLVRAATDHHRVFAYQVTLPHYRDTKFLEAAVQNYLSVVQTGDTRSVAYPYDRGFIWRTHMLDPLAYYKDSKLVGRHAKENQDVVATSRPSNDTILRGKSRSDLSASEPIAGAMFRGLPPPVVEKIGEQELIKMANRTIIFEIKSIRLENLEDHRYFEFLLNSYSHKTQIARQLFAKKIHSRGNIWIHTYEEIEIENTFEFDTAMYDTLEIQLVKTADERLFNGEKEVPPVENVYSVEVRFPDGEDYQPGEDFKLSFKLPIRKQASVALPRVIQPASDVCGYLTISCMKLVMNSATLRFPLVKYPSKSSFHICDVVKHPTLMAAYSSNLDDDPCFYCDIGLIDTNENQPLVCRIIKTDLNNFESVEIMDKNNHVISSSHLIGRESLPGPDQVGDSATCCVLQSKIEIVHLVRSTNYDFALVKVVLDENEESTQRIQQVLLFPLSQRPQWVTLYPNQLSTGHIHYQTPTARLKVDLKSLRISVYPAVTSVFSELIALGCTIVSIFSTSSPQWLVLPHQFVENEQA